MRKRESVLHTMSRRRHMSKEQKSQAFYIQSPEEVLKAVDATEQGLSSSEAEKRLAEFGHNELEEGEKRSILVKFIEQFKDLMIIILVAAAILSVVTSGGEDIADAIIILAVVIIKCCLWCLPRRKSRRSHRSPQIYVKSSCPRSSRWSHGGD